MRIIGIYRFFVLPLFFNLFVVLFGCVARADSVEKSAEESMNKVGDLIYFTGQVKLEGQDGVSREAKIPTALFAGDSITTSRGATAQIRMVDGVLFALQTDSKIKLSSYKKESVLIDFFRGALRSTIGNWVKENPKGFELRTSVASIGIREAVFETFFIPESGWSGAQKAPSGQFVKVLQGAVIFSNADKKSVTVDQHKVAFVPPRQFRVFNQQPSQMPLQPPVSLPPPIPQPAPELLRQAPPFMADY